MKRKVGNIFRSAIFNFLFFIAFILIPIYFYGTYIRVDYLSGLPYIDPDYSTIANGRWNVPSFGEERFVFEVEIGNPDFPDAEVYINSIDYYGLGTYKWFKANATVWGEWGYSFHHLTGGLKDGSGITHYGGFPTAPSNKIEAYNYMQHLQTRLRPITT